MTNIPTAPAIEYAGPRRKIPLSGRAFACFFFACISLSFSVAFFMLRDLRQSFLAEIAGILIILAPIAAGFSVVYGVMAFSHFPDDRGIFYRGRWMAIFGLIIAIMILIVLISLVVWFVIVNGTPLQPSYPRE